jgi:hypothetical protein
VSKLRIFAQAAAFQRSAFMFATVKKVELDEKAKTSSL